MQQGSSHSSEQPSGQAAGFVGIFIQRPVLAAVLSLLVAIAGFAAMQGIEIRELPDVDRPVVTIDTSYPGATPEAMDAQVTSIIESAVAKVDGVQSISSSSSYARSRVVAEFSSSSDINIAATDIKNAVSGISRDLPDDIDEPRVVKADSDSSPVMRIAVSAEKMDPGVLADLVDDVILPRLQAIEGVAQADDYGVKNRVIRVRIMPVSLAARGYTIDDVMQVLATASQSAPSGQLRSASQQLLIRTESEAVLPEQIGALKLDDNTRISDIAIVEWGFEDQTTSSRVDGTTGIGIGIVRQAQSNTLLVAKNVRAAVDELTRELPPNVIVDIVSDDAIFIQQSVNEVIRNLLLSTLIVVCVIFLFLRSLRATVIPAITIPVSLLGTIALLWIAGFSINLITLLALVMATGLVVDDAIVVTENIQRWRSKGAGVRAAAILGTREIIFAVLSTTATLAAVFIPISFLPGEAGQLFSEFGFTLAFAVVVSSLVALTLCPVLTIKFGGGEKSPSPKNATATENPSTAIKQSALTRLYSVVIRHLLGHPIAVIGVCLLFASGAFFTFKALPMELTPKEDRGRVFILVAAQQGASFEYLDRKVLEVENRIAPLIESGEVSSIQSINGIGGGTRSFIIARMPAWSEREYGQAELENTVRNLTSGIPGISIFIRSGSSLGIRGAGQGLKFAVIGDDYGHAADAAELLATSLNSDPMFDDVRLDFQVSQPQISIRIDREAATALNIPINSITTTIQTMADEYRAADIFVGDDIIEVLATTGGDPVNDPTDLENIFLRSSSGVSVPLSSVASVSETAVASNLSREQRRRAVPITATLAEGTRLGDAIIEMRRVAAEELSGGMSVTLLGEARVLENSNQNYIIVIGVAALIVLLVLAAQFESFVSAFILMATAPFGLAAAIYAIGISGGSINFYSQIGLVLLIGIMAKNGILIVEFANQLRDDGAGVREAIERAAITRFRPVLMTAISTFLGGFPLILGSGAGAESRAALGWVVVGGLGFATFFTLFLTPVAFLLLAGFSKPRASESQKVAEELASAPKR
ncbi:efflux RND transporter permease subunit [Hyphococcus lacteus]|uniref:Efflux RND transporter permease subunit n=1 Tax=Hyphococcus lacteus TaxID=3143536 RepID=A0ABV3Z7F4_9PROT